MPASTMPQGTRGPLGEPLVGSLPWLTIALLAHDGAASPARSSLSPPQPATLAVVKHRATPPASGPAAGLPAGETALLALLVVGLIGVVLWSLPRRPGGRRQPPGDSPSPLLPTVRWGATHHERLQDPTYLSRILEAELSSDEQERRTGTGETPKEGGPETSLSGSSHQRPPDGPAA